MNIKFSDHIFDNSDLSNFVVDSYAQAVSGTLQASINNLNSSLSNYVSFNFGSNTISGTGNIKASNIYLTDAVNTSELHINTIHISNDKIGIGTANPTEDIHIVGVGNSSSRPTLRLDSYSTSTTWEGSPYIILSKSHSNDTSTPSQTQNGEVLSYILTNGVTSSNAFGSAASIHVVQTGNSGASGWYIPTLIGFEVGSTNGAQTIARMFYSTFGNSLLEIGTSNVTGGMLQLQGSTSGYIQIRGSAAAGSWTMMLPSSGGTNGYQLQTNGTGTTSWASAGSLRELKNIDSEATISGSGVMDKIINTKVYNFHYKPDMGTLDSTTQYVGVMADEAPWAMHFDGSIVNPINTLGYMILGVQALYQEIIELEAEIELLKQI